MPATPLSRRTTVGLAGLGAGLGLAAAGYGVRTVSGRASAAGVSDDLVAEQARAAILTRLALVRRTARRHPDLRAALRPLVTLHRTHAGLLTPAGDATATPPSQTRIPRDRAAALAAVTASEQTLQRELTTLAVEAESGPLARVLAGMVAGTAQRTAVLA